MDYRSLQLEKINIPLEAEKKAKSGSHWQYEAAQGILLQIEYAKDGKPAFCAWGGDTAEGLKYEILINPENKQLAPLTKAIKKINKEYSWMNYIVSEIDKNPKLASSTTAYACNTVFGLNIWTTAKAEFSVLLEEVSKAIAALAPDPSAKFDAAAQKAMTNEKGIEAFAKTIEKNRDAMSTYQNLAAITEALFEKWTTDKLLPFLAAVCYVGGFADTLKQLVEKYKIRQFLVGHPDTHERLFLLLQQNLRSQYGIGQKGYYTKEYFGGFIRLLACALCIFDYEVYPKGIETVIRLFENDSVEGVSYELYKAATEYNAGDFGCYDSMENEEYYNKLWAEMDVKSYIG
ncbi:hypothetical protein ACYULU_03235 [Breznakiellaceae bacterium SP9]